ncbi:MAG: CBS domain-containing protein [Thermoanaerobaculales bacterium]|nr:CBS domain-containing protein [Thermoanaerobaculales bacterium]
MHSLARRYATAHPEAAANRLQELADDEAATFLAGLEAKAAAAVIAELWPATAAAIVDRVDLDRTAKILEMLNLSRTVALLRQLPADARDRMLNALPPTIGSRVHTALSLPAGTAGSEADVDVIPFDADTTVGEALGRGIDPRLPYLYVIDRDYRLVGVIHRRELKTSEESAPLRTIMRTPVQRIPAATPLAVLQQHAAWSAFDALPVVDARGAFLGVIRHKALRAAPQTRRMAPGPTTALTALLDLGEVYWSGLFSAIEVLAEGAANPEHGGLR